jgi:UDP-N-acetylmuramoyl-tripeptide--D-alanyl-D-alanine ligase
MTFWELESLRSTLKGAWLAAPTAKRILTGVCTDSRAVEQGQIFIALKGERMDGHEYLVQAVHSGAGLLVVDDPTKISEELNEQAKERHVPIMQVGNTGDGLLALAGAWRRALTNVPVVAVTGSNGKTTTTRLIESVLTDLGAGTASIKSFNNRIGVPLTILRARSTDKFLVCEVGTNAIGEIAELAAVIEPDVTVITSIGREHLEGLGGIQGSVNEAVELVKALRPGGTVIVPAGCRELDQAIAKTPLGTGATAGKVLKFGESSDCDLCITDIRFDEPGVGFRLGAESYAVPLIGRHNAHNAAAAVAVGLTLGVDPAVLARSLANAKGAEMRLERRSITLPQGPPAIDVINDAYNANPESMLAAIVTFKDMFGSKSRRKVVVLGDMLELGEHGPDCHREIGDALASAGVFDLCILIGPLMMFAADRVGKALGPNRVVPLPKLDETGGAKVAAMFQPGDAVLLKGSRGMGIERVLKALEAATTPVAVKG